MGSMILLHSYTGAIDSDTKKECVTAAEGYLHGKGMMAAWSTEMKGECENCELVHRERHVQGMSKV